MIIDLLDTGTDRGPCKHLLSSSLNIQGSGFYTRICSEWSLDNSGLQGLAKTRDLFTLGLVQKGFRDCLGHFYM